MQGRTYCRVENHPKPPLKGDGDRREAVAEGVYGKPRRCLYFRASLSRFAG